MLLYIYDICTDHTPNGIGFIVRIRHKVNKTNVFDHISYRMLLYIYDIYTANTSNGFINFV